MVQSPLHKGDLIGNGDSPIIHIFLKILEVLVCIGCAKPVVCEVSRESFWHFAKQFSLEGIGYLS